MEYTRSGWEALKSIERDLKALIILGGGASSKPHDQIRVSTSRGLSKPPRHFGSEALLLEDVLCRVAKIAEAIRMEAERPHESRYFKTEWKKIALEQPELTDQMLAMLAGVHQDSVRRWRREAGVEPTDTLTAEPADALRK